MAGSTTIPAELIRRVEKEWGANFVPCYGQTECSGVIVQGLPEDTPEDKSDWAGRPLEQVEVRVVDPATGRVVPHGGGRRVPRPRIHDDGRLLRDAGGDRRGPGC